ncbi:preprotein translocase subunit SecG [Leuconostoc mesenteroides]
MYSILIYVMIVVNILIILFILSQPSKQQDSLSLLNGDSSSNLFANHKFRGTNFILQLITAFLGLGWLVLGLVIMCLG